MAELKFIVDALNKPPFEMRLSLVTFDEKNPFELLQILNDVLKYLDKHHDVDLRDEPREQTGQRIMQSLHLLKYKFPHNNIDQFKLALVQGDRNTIYPVLHWLLQRLDTLKKRAYLARFLVNIEVPTEFFQVDEIKEVHGHYKQLQQQFKMVHKQYDKLKQNHQAPQDLKKEIQQLEEERQQLKESISTKRRKTANMKDFSKLLEVTSALRQEQEEEAALSERMREQQHILMQAEARTNELRAQLHEMEQNATTGVGAQTLLDNLQREVAENRALVKETLPRRFAARQEKFQSLQELTSQPTRTEDDVRELESHCMMLEQQIQQLNHQIQEAQAKMQDDKLSIFRSQAAMVQKKLKQKQQEVEVAQAEAKELKESIGNKEAVLSELTGPTFMTRDKFKEYAGKLRMKTNKYKQLKQELATIRAESVVLSRTEQILRSRDANLSDLLKKIEAEKGVSGYMQTQEELAKVSQAKSTTDTMKGKTLEEISAIVTDINMALKERKNKLAPQIKELRALRQRYQEVEQGYLEKKAIYDNTAVGLESERLKIEKACEAGQEECLREESRYHYLNCLLSVANAQLDKVKQEQEYSRGKGKLLRDFKNYTELYNHKLQQQAALSKELHKRQKDIKENADENLNQKQLFLDLKKLLDCKKKISEQEKKERDNSDSIAIDKMVGGANVMTIE